LLASIGQLLALIRVEIGARSDAGAGVVASSSHERFRGSKEWSWGVRGGSPRTERWSELRRRRRIWRVQAESGEKLVLICRNMAG
jgi:hypothetical protein